MPVNTSAIGDSVTEEIGALRLIEKPIALLTPPPSEEKHPSSQKSSSNHSDPEAKSSSEMTLYLESLKEERDQLANYTGGLTHVFTLIDKEIQRVSGDEEARSSTENVQNSKSTISEIIPVPVDLYPNYNFVGRILGPRGTTAKQLESATGCRIIVHGRRKETFAGSSSETQATSSPSSETKEPLSIEISCPANVVGARQKLEMGISVIKSLLIPPADGQDELKRQQLMVLANMNGTYRSRNDATSTPPTPNTSISNSPWGDYSNQLQNLLPYGYRLPLANCHHEMMLKSLLYQNKPTTGQNSSTGNENYPIHHPMKCSCDNRKCVILRSLLDNNVPMSNNYDLSTHPPIQITNMEDMFNMMQWYEMMNRMRFSSSQNFSEPIKTREEFSRVQEITSRLCSSLSPFGQRPANPVSTARTPRNLNTKACQPNQQAIVDSTRK